MAISGLTGFQRTLWMANKLGKRRGLQEVKEHMKKMGQRKDGPVVGDRFSAFSQSYFIQLKCRSSLSAGSVKPFSSGIVFVGNNNSV